MSEKWSTALSIAPMLDVTDRHYRFLMRQLSRRTLLYTEMVVDTTILHQMSNLDYFIGHSYCEDPVAVQLGGSNPETVSEAAYITEAWGNYCEINLNVGCPSPRVSQKCFGARLMLDPDRVRQITSEMIRKVSRTEVTVKCRIGADDQDSYGHLCEFVEAVRSAGVRRFILHARKCLLDGLSASQNRSVPPLKYEVVHRLKRDFPELSIAINGGIDTFDAARSHFHTWQDEDGSELPPVDGVMMGRSAWNHPTMFAGADSAIFGATDPTLTYQELLDRYIDYCDLIQGEFGPKKNISGKIYDVCTGVLIKPLNNLFHGIKGVRNYKVAMNDMFLEARRNRVEVPVKEMLETCLRFLPESVMESVVGETPVRDASNLGATRDPFNVRYEVFGPSLAPEQRSAPPPFCEDGANEAKSSIAAVTQATAAPLIGEAVEETKVDVEISKL